MQILLTIVALLIVLGIVVFVHELGHFLAARWAGVRVDAFSIGFGPAIIKWHDKRGTLWKIACLPLGGYVSIYGQEDMFNRKKFKDLAVYYYWRRCIYELCLGMGDLYIFVYVSTTFSWKFAVACNWSGYPRICGI